MKIIQIRGCNASGKTTVVKEFLKKHNFELKKIYVKNKKTHISVLHDANVVVLGRYDKKIGGCDFFENKEHVFNTAVWVLCNFRNATIIFEGLIYSFTYKFASKIADFFKHYNYHYIGLCLYIDPVVALKRLYIRNGGKQVKENLIYQKTKSVIVSYKKLFKNGYDVKLINTGKIKYENMADILENELNGKQDARVHRLSY